MSKHRIKHIAPAISTRTEAEQTLGAIRDLTIHRNQLLLKQEAEIKAVQDKYADSLQIIEKQLERNTELLSGWAEGNPSEFGKSKSLDMTHGKLGWRTGMPKLVKKSKATWDALVETVCDLLGSDYIRIKKEVNREAIVDARATIPPERLQKCGLSIVQEETFFVDPNLEEIENRRTT
ncbi:MAG: host-nuclease inhibitor Gam family protein [Verrucomicrobiota bacterium]